jgi:hypothetical protein
MDRRAALCLLTTAAAIPASAMAVLRAARAALPAAPALKTLTAQQNATLCAMADLLLPRTETPGALDARVNEFIDLLLTEWFDPPERDRFLAGLADVDARSQKQFSKEFVALARSQQAEIVTVLGSELLADLHEIAQAPRSYRGSAPKLENFYFTFRRLVLTAYFTSQPGATEALHYAVIPAVHNGCAELTEASPSPD